MNINPVKIGEQIRLLRKNKNLTQEELGERVGITYQAVSKWERGEALPDVGLLPDLAAVLETTIDHILLGGERIAEFQRRVTVEEIKDGIACLPRMGELMGRENLFYIGAVEGINCKMNMDIEAYLQDPYTTEALIAEALLQNIQGGAYVDISDIKKGFAFPHWRDMVLSYAEKYGLK